MKQDYKRRKRWLPAVLAVVLMSLMVPAAHAYEYVTLSGSTGYTSAYLNSTCSGRHVKIEGSATTLNIYAALTSGVCISGVGGAVILW